MHVVLWGAYDLGKPRIRILRAGLVRNGIQLTECHVDVWRGVEDKSQMHGVGRWLWRLLRLLAAYPLLIARYLCLPRHDLVLVSYPGLLDLYVIRLFARMRKVPVAWDWFISAYDTIVLDRRLLQPDRVAAKLIKAVEGCGARRADLLFMDTAAHARRMESLYLLPRDSVGRVWVGAEAERFAPAPVVSPPADGAPLRVLFYGQFIPLHGIETIVAAARLLCDAPVEWTLVGDGQEAGRIRNELASHPLARLRWVPWVPYAELAARIAEADVCLGIFGTSDKAASVIPNKVFQTLCSGRPLITRDSPAMRELLPHPPRACRLVPPGDPAALAAAVLAVGEDLRYHADTLGDMQCVDSDVVGRQFLQLTDRFFEAWGRA